MSCIALVEDDPRNRSVFGAILARGGWTVLAAETPAEGFALCQRHREAIDLIILDRALPVESGTELALRIRAALPAVPMLFVSGTPIEFWDQEDHCNLKRLANGSYSFLQKPFTSGALVQKVRERLAGLSIASAA